MFLSSQFCISVFFSPPPLSRLRTSLSGVSFLSFAIALFFIAGSFFFFYFLFFLLLSLLFFRCDLKTERYSRVEHGWEFVRRNTCHVAAKTCSREVMRCAQTKKKKRRRSVLPNMKLNFEKKKNVQRDKNGECYLALPLQSSAHFAAITTLRCHHHTHACVVYRGKKKKR